jgi:hypothetical protein
MVGSQSTIVSRPSTRRGNRHGLSDRSAGGKSESGTS